MGEELEQLAMDTFYEADVIPHHHAHVVGNVLSSRAMFIFGGGSGTSFGCHTEGPRFVFAAWMTRLARWPCS